MTVLRNILPPIFAVLMLLVGCDEVDRLSHQEPPLTCVRGETIACDSEESCSGVRTCVLADPSCDPDKPGQNHCPLTTRWSECQVPKVGETCSSNVGECRQGVWKCENGETYCDGGIWPRAESCNGKDDNCNQQVDEIRYVDPVVDGKKDAFCYEGPAETIGEDGFPMGICSEGRWECKHSRNGSAQWVCGGQQVLPRQELCGNGQDNNCDGQDDIAGSVGQVVDMVFVLDRTASMRRGEWNDTIYALREFLAANESGPHNLRIALVGSPGDEPGGDFGGGWEKCGVWDTSSLNVRTTIGFLPKTPANATAFQNPRQTLRAIDETSLSLGELTQPFPNYGPHHFCLWRAAVIDSNDPLSLNLDFRTDAKKIVVFFSDDSEGWGHVIPWTFAQNAPFPTGLTPEMIGNHYASQNVSLFSFDRTRSPEARHPEEAPVQSFMPAMAYEPIVRKSNRLAEGTTTEGYQFPLHDTRSNLARELKGIVDKVACSSR